MAGYTLWLDTETRNETPIDHGTYAYAETVDIDIISWAIDDGPVEHVDFQECHMGDVSMVCDLINEARILVAHNAMFDRNVFRLGNLKLVTPIEKWRCTMVRALAHGLPGALDKLGELLGLPTDKKKIADGRKLMLMFCKPLAANRKLRWATAQTHPEQRAKYLDYCDHDVIAMRALAEKLPVWNMAADYPADGEAWTAGHTELAHWHRDQYMNDRGYLIDAPFAEAALRAVALEQKRLKKRTQEATDGALNSATQRDKLIEFLLAEYGVTLPNMRKTTLEKAIADPLLDDGLRELLRLRLSTCTTSTAKYTSVLKGRSPDGRLRGTIQMNGAARTRRAAGRLFQPQNLPSRGLLPAPDIEIGIKAMMLGCEEMFFEDIMNLAASTIRGCIIAPPGRKLVIADLSNIEGRVLAWLAGERWKLKAFQEFDAGRGEDLYKVTYGRSFGFPVALVNEIQRQLGKVLELACGYQGSFGAFMAFSATYGINLDDMARNVLPTLSAEAIEKAADRIAWHIKNKHRLPNLQHDTLIAIQCLVMGWRDSHPATVTLWKNLEAFAIAAVQNPGKLFQFDRFAFKCSGSWLRIRLPSGRFLCYPQPQVSAAGKLSYMGIDQFTHQWKRIATYGGKIAENATQLTARDILYDPHPRIEEAGYELILHIHDENITEAPDSPEFNADELVKLMTLPPSWNPDGESYALDLPLAAKGYETYRYRKG